MRTRLLTVSVQTRGLNILLSVVPLSEAKPHEATIPEAVSSLLADLERTSMQRDPILIDSKTRTVLDGMHRREALEKAGAKFALCSEYDYLSDSIKLERWLRYFIAPSEDFLSEVKTMLELEEVEDFRDAARAVDDGESQLSLLSAGISFTSGRDWDVLRIYDAVGKIDELCRKYRIEVNYTPESSKFELFTSESVFLLYPEPLTKSDVLRIASTGRVFPCKTTRHIVPVRPMGVYFPLYLLKGGAEEQCSKELDQIVKLSTMKLEEREIWYEGRRYSEPLAVFRREK